MRSLTVLMSGLALCAHAQVRELAAAARAFPPEFAADAILRLAAGSGESPAWKRAQIEEAFHLAAGAGREVKRTSTARGRGPRPLEAFTADMNLDALSLKSRAVTEMLRIDARKGREMFESLALPALPAAGCDAGIADLSAYYEALGAVVRSGFTAAERRRGAPVQLVAGAFQSVNSVAQAGPAARLLLSLPLDDAALQALAAIYSGVLAGLPADANAFATAMGRDRLDVAIGGLASLLEARRLSTGWLARDVQRFLATQFAAPACTWAAGQAFRTVLDNFNRRFGSLAGELDPERISEPAAAPEISQAVDGAMIERLSRLRATAPEDPAFSHRARELVDAISSWDPPGEAAASLFHRKSALFQALLSFLPTGPERRNALEVHTRLIAGAALLHADPAGWFCHAEALAEQLRAARALDLLRQLEAAGGGLLDFAARVEGIAPRPPARAPEPGVFSALAGPDAMRAELVAFLLN